ncbi:methylenetetrahydrofolate reductase [NAD(P)H] [Aristophania vespae]|uniref:Methylenetetrahydrofolate reductase n=1 Tax=Aristophania vespae TaxID=2697033 RepID=A0A6P1NEU9_9PROT|nr:methylenetetrahydrofolate reductase [NAD(P)H] [Aristophania vespae]QHI95080.1 methylenetetrahydrofolate reductase [NAD(P)H] [Aristophania vespae]
MPAYHNAGHRPEISFEFFPAKTKEGHVALLETARNLASLSPSFMSVTYGAGGSTQERTLETLSDMASELSVPLAGHLTCVGASKDEVHKVAQAYWDAGIKHILALRGDPPPVNGKPTAFQPHPQGYKSACELVKGLKKLAPFKISVAAYPETHPQAISSEADIDNLKRKFDAGADQAITQFFFSPEAFLKFRDKLSKIGVDKAVIPGILPISNAEQAWKFATICGAAVPKELRDLFEGVDEYPAVRTRLAAAIADRICQTLRSEGVEHFHFYTLNKSAASTSLSLLLGRHLS